MTLTSFQLQQIQRTIDRYGKQEAIESFGEQAVKLVVHGDGSKAHPYRTLGVE